MIDPEFITNPLERQTDEELIVGFQKGNAAAFDLLVGRYKDPLTNYVFRFLGDWDDCNDVVQETFVRVFQNRASYKPIAKFSTWIYTIASNLAKNELRNRSRNPLVFFQTIKRNWEADHRPLQFEDATARPDDLYRKRFLKDAVEQCVSQLPEHHRVVFVLRELEGKSYEEIAEITGCNLGTVKSRLNRARNSFAQLIGPLVS